MKLLLIIFSLIFYSSIAFGKINPREKALQEKPLSCQIFFVELSNHSTDIEHPADSVRKLSHSGKGLPAGLATKQKQRTVLSFDYTDSVRLEFWNLGEVTFTSSYTPKEGLHIDFLFEIRIPGKNRLSVQSSRFVKNNDLLVFGDFKSETENKNGLILKFHIPE